MYQKCIVMLLLRTVTYVMLSIAKSNIVILVNTAYTSFLDANYNGNCSQTQCKSIQKIVMQALLIILCNDSQCGLLFGN